RNYAPRPHARIVSGRSLGPPRWRTACVTRTPTGRKSRCSGGMRDALYWRMDIITWLVVGLVAGVLASLVVGGYGILADIVIGIVGAFIGGYLFTHAHWQVPFHGLAGTIFVAFIGALILLVVLRLFRAAAWRG